MITILRMVNIPRLVTIHRTVTISRTNTILRSIAKPRMVTIPGIINILRLWLGGSSWEAALRQLGAAQGQLKGNFGVDLGQLGGSSGTARG